MNDRQFTILFLASSYPRDATDSASVFLRDLADHLAQNSVKIDVLVPADGKADTIIEAKSRYIVFNTFQAPGKRLLTARESCPT